jgi:hypothetical protein
VPQTFQGAAMATTLEGAEQVIARGPAAAQVAVKQLGTNGGGFFGVNSAHPFENPTVASNMAQSLSILLIPVTFAFLFGRIVGDRRQGWAIFAAMAVLFVAGLAVIHVAEAAGNPLLGLAGANMEGKEQRFGATLSALWAASATAASNRSANAMHDSLMPLSGLVMLVNMQVGEVVFGGVGAGLYGMLLCVVLAVFLAGLMVGRTPEYLGHKIEGREVTLSVLAFVGAGLPVDAGGHPGRRRHQLQGAADAGLRAGGGPPRLLRDALRLLLSHRQQRLGPRRLGRGQPLADHRARDRHAVWPLRHHRAHAGRGGLAGAQDAGRGHGGNLLHPRAPLRHAQPRSRPRWMRSPARAARPSWSRTASASWAPSISRTSSSPACASASPSCAAWASAR